MRINRLLALVFLAVFLYGLAGQGHHEMRVFMDRDFARARELLEGHRLFFGPELTGGSNLPGPLFAWLMALPLAGGFGIAGVWLIACLLVALGATLIYREVHRLTQNPASAWLAAATYAWSPLQSRMMRAFMNSSFVSLFAVLGVLGILHAFDSTRSLPSRMRALIGLGVILGLGIQIHYSVVALLVAAAVTQITVPSARLPLRAWTGALLGLLIPLLPYLLWSAGWIPLHPGDQTPVGQAPFWRALVSLVDCLQEYRSLGTFDAPGTLLTQLLYLLPVPIAGLLWLRKRPLPAPLAVLLGVSFLSAAYLWFSEHGSRYGGVFVAASACAVGWVHAELGARRIWWATTGAGITLLLATALYWDPHALTENVATRLALFAALLIPSAVVLGRHQAPAWAGIAALFVGQIFFESVPPAFAHVLTPAELRPLARWVIQNENWTYEDWMSRTYFLLGHHEQGFEEIYRETLREPSAPRPDHAPWSGVFLVAGTEFPKSRDAALAALEAQELPHEIAAALESGAIHLFDPVAFPGAWAAPYRVDKPLDYPPTFHNLGLGYDQPPELEEIEALTGTEGVFSMGPGTLRFHWNQCVDLAPYCRTSATVRVAPASARGHLHINVRIEGRVLSQSSRWIIPDQTQGWFRPYVFVKCGQKKQRYRLATGVGFRHKERGTTLETPGLMPHAMLAPFHRALEVDCPGGLERVGMGYDLTTTQANTEKTLGDGRYLESALSLPSKP